MQKAQSKWVFLTWSLCFIALLFVTIALCFVFVFLLSLFLGFALHSIHAFHSRIFFLIIKKKKKGSKMCFTLFSCIWNKGWPIYFYITCLCTLFSLDELGWAYLLHFISWSFAVHVVWEDVYSFWSHDLDLEITCFWLSDLNLLRKA